MKKKERIVVKRCVQLPVHDKSVVPEGFVKTSTLFGIPKDKSVYNGLILAAKEGRVRSYKVVPHVGARKGAVYVHKEDAKVFIQKFETTIVRRDYRVKVRPEAPREENTQQELPFDPSKGELVKALSFLFVEVKKMGADLAAIKEAITNGVQ